MKPSTYMTRAMRSKDGRYALALGKLGYVEPMAAKSAPLNHDGDGQKSGSKPAEQSDELTSLRALYQDKFGKRAYHGWDADALRQKISEGEGEE